MYFLGKSPESYSSLLTPIMLRKLQKEVRKGLARDHSNTEWMLNELRSSILKKIQVLETGIHTSGQQDQSFRYDTPPMTTFSFYTGTQYHPIQSMDTRKPTHCVYCKWQHSSNSSDVFTSPQDRLTIVKRDNLYFNCLAHHQVTHCNFKFRCRVCKCKHHTSLCTKSTQLNTPGDTHLSLQRKTGMIPRRF